MIVLGGLPPEEPDTEEKRRRVLRLLADPVWAGRSTNWIAREAGVSWLFADKVRVLHDGDGVPDKREARDGSSHPPYSGRRR